MPLINLSRGGLGFGDRGPLGRNPPLPSPQLPPAAPPPAPSIPPPVALDPEEIANATYGKTIPIFAGGKARIGGNFISGPHYTTVSNGKAASFGVSFGFPANVDGNRQLLEINMDSKLAWSLAGGYTGESFTYRFYQGRLDQSIDAIETANWGANAHSYGPQMVLFFENLPIAAFGNRIPYISATIGDITDGADPDDGINIGTALERIAYSPWIEYTADEFEAVGIVDVVPAMLFASNISFLDLLRNIARIYRNLDIIQTDKLRVIDRGNFTPDFNLNLSKIIAQPDSDPLSFSRIAPSEVSRELELITIDPDADYSLLASKARRPREPVVVSASVGKETVTLPFVMDAETRLAMVTYAKYAEEQERKKIVFTGMPELYEAEPGDVLLLAPPNAGFEYELFKITETLHGANWTIAITAEAVLACLLPVDLEEVGEVILQLSFDGTHGATSGPGYDDESRYNHSVAPGGNAAISTTQSKFGGSSLSVPGSLGNSRVHVAHHAVFNGLSTANSDRFTVEAWIRPTSLSVDANGCVIAGDNGGIGGTFWDFRLLPTGELRWIWSSTGNDFTDQIDTTSAGIVIDTWYHVAVDKDATGKIRLYVNGTMRGSGTPASSVIATHSTGGITIGRTHLSSRHFIGFIDELRIRVELTYGTDAGFTAPTNPFPPPSQID